MNHFLTFLLGMSLFGAGCTELETGPDTSTMILVTLDGHYAYNDRAEVLVVGLTIVGTATGGRYANVIVGPGEHVIEARSLIDPEQSWPGHIVRIDYGEKYYDTLKCDPAWLTFSNRCEDSLQVEFQPANRYITPFVKIGPETAAGTGAPSGKSFFKVRDRSGNVIDSGTTPLLKYGEFFNYELKCP